MPDFTKLANYLDSFSKGDRSYDLACYIKTKIANDLRDTSTINNGDEEELDDTDITMSTPEQQSSDNVEGDIMSEAFKEFDVLDKLKEEKEHINMPDTKDRQGNPVTDAATEASFGDNVQNKQASLFDLLKNRFKQ